MTTAPPAPSETPARPTWLAAADPLDGHLISIDGEVAAHRAGKAEPSYRVEIRTQDCRVDVGCDGFRLRFTCWPADDGRPAPAIPGERFGWSVRGVDRHGHPHVLPARVGQVITACLHDRDAEEAIADITAWVAEEAELRCAQLREQARSGRDRAAHRCAASAWRQAAGRLRESLRHADRLRRVPTRLLRDEFLRQAARGEVTAAQVALRCGWHWDSTDGPPKGDSARLLRRLALIPEPSDQRAQIRRRFAGCGELDVLHQLDAVTATLTYDVAVRLCRALGRDPADFGVL